MNGASDSQCLGEFKIHHSEFRIRFLPYVTTIFAGSLQAPGVLPGP
jgi:hypothetical protein